MRATSIAVAAALTVTCLATSLQGQQPERPIDPRAQAFADQAARLRTAGNLDGASDLLETALAIDPRDRAALVALGDLARQRGLPGNAVHLYREALLLDPNDVAALRGRGEALVDKGAVRQAQADLAKLRAVCGAAACPAATELSTAIAKGPPIATAQVVKPATSRSE